MREKILLFFFKKGTFPYNVFKTKEEESEDESEDESEEKESKNLSNILRINQRT